MESAKFEVTYTTDVFPAGLLTAEQVAPIGISAERISELALAGYLPHYRIDGGTPLFKQKEVKIWLAQNLLSQHAGRSFPDSIRVVIPAPPVTDRPPMSISNVPYLQQLPKHGYQPGVYFLCKGGKVVYVGQSTKPGSRVGDHVNDPIKDFDRVYLLPAPLSELNDIEAAFILHLLPSQQGGIRNGYAKPVHPGMSRPLKDILTSVGLPSDMSKESICEGCE